jgi:large subunit ribosomal protein L4
LNKKVRALGMKMALSAKAAEGSLIILDQAALDAPKTKVLLENFGKLGLTNALVIGGAQVDTNFQLAARNVPNVDVLPAAGLNVYDVLRRHKLVLSRDAIEAISARFASKGEAA